MNRRSSIAATLCGRLPCEMTTVTTPRESANLRSPGYEHPDSRLSRRMHSPLTHKVPRQGAHRYLAVSPVPVCPIYTFGYTPIDHRRGRSPPIEGRGRAQPLDRHAWATPRQILPTCREFK